MEKRTCKVHVYKAGGNCGKNAKKYGIGLPSTWAKAMNITPEDREVTITFDGSAVLIQKAEGKTPEKE